MKPLLRFLLLAALTVSLIACVQLAEVDSSRLPVFASMMGKEYELKEEFLVRGVKRNLKSVEPDYILIMTPPGIGGRYTYDLGRVPAGRRFRIVGVVTHRSELFPSTRYVVSFLDHRIAGAESREIRITDTPGWELYTQPASPQEAPQLSERFFRPVEAAQK